MLLHHYKLKRWHITNVFRKVSCSRKRTPVKDRLFKLAHRHTETTNELDWLRQHALPSESFFAGENRTLSRQKRAIRNRLISQLQKTAFRTYRNEDDTTLSRSYRVIADCVLSVLFLLLIFFFPLYLSTCVHLFVWVSFFFFL